MKMKFVIIFLALICVVSSLFIKTENREAARSKRATPQRRFHYPGDYNYEYRRWKNPDNPNIEHIDCPVEICPDDNEFYSRGDIHESKAKFCDRHSEDFSLCFNQEWLDSPHSAPKPTIIPPEPKYGYPRSGIGRKSALFNEQEAEFKPEPQQTIAGRILSKWGGKMNKIGKVLIE